MLSDIQRWLGSPVRMHSRRVGGMITIVVSVVAAGVVIALIFVAHSKIGALIAFGVFVALVIIAMLVMVALWAMAPRRDAKRTQGPQDT